MTVTSALLDATGTRPARFLSMRSLFAGAGGLCLAAESRGIASYGWEIMPGAIATREASGLRTSGNDVRAIIPERGRFQIVGGGPPCQPFSRQGNRAGVHALHAVTRGVMSYRTDSPMTYAQLAASTGDDRTALVVEPLRIIIGEEPEFVLLEQVPAVLPVWQAYEQVLRERGYLTVSGVLRAQDFGVSQTRKRAFLLARRDGVQPHLPAPTSGPVMMAEALGWGMTHRVGYTVTGGGTDTGGAEPWGNQARQAMRAEYAANRWTGPARFRPTISEAATLQGLQALALRGSLGSQFLQVGNAVPRKLGEAVLDALLAGVL